MIGIKWRKIMKSRKMDLEIKGDSILQGDVDIYD